MLDLSWFRLRCILIRGDCCMCLRFLLIRGEDWWWQLKDWISPLTESKRAEELCWRQKNLVCQFFRTFTNNDSRYYMLIPLYVSFLNSYYQFWLLFSDFTGWTDAVIRTNKTCITTLLVWFIGPIYSILALLIAIHFGFCFVQDILWKPNVSYQLVFDSVVC